MLVRFTVENFLSFKERCELSMIPGRVRRHPEHVIKAQSYSGISTLKSAIIYGANASGKTNLIKAMKHVQELILKTRSARSKIPYFPFLLDSKLTNKPSRFEFEIKIKNKYYAYGFVADQKIIHEEWLFELNKRKEKLIFNRINTTSSKNFQYDESNFKNEKDKQFFSFAFKGTPDNRLFLNEFIERQVNKELDYLDDISAVCKWFKDKLRIIFPHSKYEGLEVDIEEESPTVEILSKVLKNLDTGVNKVCLKNVELEQLKNEIPKVVLDDMEENVDSDSYMLLSGPKNKRFLFERKKNGLLKAKKLMTIHLDFDGNEKYFEINQESDGTQRLMDLIPGFWEIFISDKTYIIDELERSLHSDITTSLFKTFFESTTNRESQLIATTHETNLLNQEILRKDEIWFVAKTKDGSSKLYSLEEFQPRFDKNIRNGYLDGRFGGVPNLINLSVLSQEIKSAKRKS
ncbi:MAG: ATP/GTP-binding protein [Marinicella sp.]